jgi:HSP20 family protein
MSEIEKSESATPAVSSAPTTSPWDWFDRWFPEMPRRWWPDLRRSFGDAADLMKVEERMDGDELVVRAEMPGIDPDKDVTISVTGNMLHLQAERRRQEKHEEEGRVRSEFSYGSFRRTVPLPVGASEEDVKATYKDGILEVRIPVDRKAAEARKIAVQRV